MTNQATNQSPETTFSWRGNSIISMPKILCP